MSIEDLALLEAIENRHDLEAACPAMAEVAEKGATPWEEVKREPGREAAADRSVRGISARPGTPCPADGRGSWCRTGRADGGWP